MRCLLLMLALVACGGGNTRGPAWPQPSTTADDGGESIAPHETTSVTAVVEKLDSEEDKPAASVTAPAAKPDATAAPAAAPAATQPQVEDIFIGEDLIIEIDD